MNTTTLHALKAILATDPTVPSDARDAALDILKNGVPTVHPPRARTMYRPKEAATLLGVSTRTLRNWSKKGVLAAVRPTENVVGYSAASVEALSGC